MTDIEEFEAAEKAAMAKAERMYKLTINAIGIAVGAAIIFVLLHILARHCECTSQSQMAIICQQMIIDSKKRGGK